MKRQRKGNAVWHQIGKLLMIVACSMAIPLATAWYYGETCWWVFMLMLPLTFGLGYVMMRLFRPSVQQVHINGQQELHLQVRDGAAIVTYGWILAALMGMFPFLLAGTFDNVADAYFEAMSGFATVGASVLGDIESAPRAILMWRSVTHWLGGMGIIVLFVALLANLGAGAIQIFKAEAAGPVKDKLHPKLADSARSLCKLYLFNTTVTFILMICCGMDVFDSLNHAFSIVATGGFSTRNLSIGSYNNATLEWVTTFCMYMAGVNYTLLYLAFRNRSLRFFWKSKEFKVYTAVMLGAILLVTLDILPQYGGDTATAVRHGAFHVASILTTTGFVCADYEMWVPAAQMLLILLMFSGACAGSTTCGFKIDRHIILVQQARREVQRFLHPRLVRTLKSSEKNLPEQTLHSVTTFFYLFMVIVLLSTLALCCMGLDLLDALTASLSCLGGVGPALGSLGPIESFSTAPAAAKWLCSALMLIGRLEIYTVLAVFWPAKHRHIWYKKLPVYGEQSE